MDRLEKIYSKSDINSQYIMSIGILDFFKLVSEEYFQLMIQEYLRKVVISGYVPRLKDLEEYNEIRDKIIKLYRIFFEGDE